ncbi:interleukin-13 receptor subunit alpha-1-like [Synchiropus picturatus]
MAAVSLELLILAVTLPSLTCGVDQLLPPKNLSYTWLDSFTVEVSWQEHDPVEDCIVSYLFCSLEDERCYPTENSSFITSCLTEESEQCTYSITTINKSCNLKSSLPVHVEVQPKESHAASLEDFKCVIAINKTNCSWIPESPDLKATLSYRICGESRELLNSTTECGEPYRGGQRNGCYLTGSIYIEDICMLLRTTQGSRTFRPRLVMEPPKFTVTEEGDQLRVTWMQPGVLETCDWKYHLHYSVCKKEQDERESHGSELLFYNEACRYEFKSRITGLIHCRRYRSDFGDVLSYGSNKPPDQTSLVLAIMVPLALSICVLLLCTCLRRYRKILFPKIPDPSAIFKGLTMNHGSDLKGFREGGLYAPASEQINICSVSPVDEEPDS